MHTRARAPGLFSRYGELSVLADELVERLAEQRLDGPAEDRAKHSQPAADGLGEVASNGDVAKATVPSGRTASEVSATWRARTSVREFSLSVMSIRYPRAQPLS